MNADYITAIRHAELLFNPVQASWLRIDGNPGSKSRKPSAEFKTALKGVFPAPLKGNVFVVCLFFRSNRQRIDCDNMVKHFLDGATGISWVDDSQVTAQFGVVEFDANRPRTVAVIGEHTSSMTRKAEREFTCALCSKTFTSAQYNPKFCSRACVSNSRGEDLRAHVHCAACGSLFKRRTAGQRHCSNDCRLQVLHRGNITLPPLPSCKSCGKALSKHGYAKCRACWLAQGNT